MAGQFSRLMKQLHGGGNALPIWKKIMSGKGAAGKAVHYGLPAAAGLKTYEHQAKTDRGLVDWSATGKATAIAALLHPKMLKRTFGKNKLSLIGGPHEVYKRAKIPVSMGVTIPAAGAVADFGEEVYDQMDSEKGVLFKAIAEGIPEISAAQRTLKDKPAEMFTDLGQQAEEWTQVGRSVSETWGDPEKRNAFLKQVATDVLDVGGEVAKDPRIKMGLAGLAVILAGYGGYKAIAPMKKRWKAKSEAETRQLRIQHARRKLLKLQQLQEAGNE